MPPRSRRPVRRRSYAVIVVLAALAALLTARPAAAEHTVRTDRIHGADRYETAARIARLAHPDGADVVMLANGHRFADALAAAALSRAVDAPILLTRRDSLPDDTRRALRDLGVEGVSILGGTAAVTTSVEDELRRIVERVGRLVGQTRFETAARIAGAIEASPAASIGEMDGRRTAILVNGHSFADAVAAGPLAAGQPNAFPILMTEQRRLHPMAERALSDLSIEQVVVVGGSVVISADVEQRLRALGHRTIRLAGNNRSETSARIADHGKLVAVFDTKEVHLSRADEPADALAAAPLAGRAGSPVLLAPPGSGVGPSLSAWLGRECPGVSSIVAVGGAGAVTDAALDAAARQAKRCHEPVPEQYASRPVVWVAPWGTADGTGTHDRPLGSIGQGMRQLDPGETLVVRGGTYRERVELSSSAVTPARPDAPILVEAYPGERPVIQGRLRLSGADHWTIRGINVTWDSQNASNEHMVHFRGGTGWRFTNAEVWGARSFSAILVNDGARDFHLDHLHVHHTHPTNGTNQDHLIYLGRGNHGGLIERNVLAYSPNGRGIKVGPGSLSDTGSHWLTIRYNTFFSNTGPSNLRFSGDSSHNEVYGNLLVRSSSGSAAITTYQLEGVGNVAHDNVAWEARGVVAPAPGLADGGGNTMVDPILADPASGDFRPRSQHAAGYGAHAPAGAQER